MEWEKMDKTMRFFVLKILFFFFLSLSYITFSFAEDKDGFATYYKNLIQENEGKLLWFLDSGDLSECGKRAFKLIENGKNHGIYAKDLPKLLNVRDFASLEEADIALTKAMLTFIDAMTGGGRQNAFAKKYPSLTSPINPKKWLKNVFLDREHCRTLDDVFPLHQAYLDLQQSYVTYHRLFQDKENHPEPVVTGTKPMKKGDKGENIQEVRDYLAFYGYPSSVEDTTKTNIFEDTLMEAIKKYQYHHGLDQDGVIGPQTLSMLKLTLQDRLKKICLNLERWRYLTYPLESRFLIVNIPSYRVEGYDGPKKTFVSNAIVGGAGTRTPLFKAPMTQVIVNPSWGVPTSIAVRQKLGKLQEDPDYFVRAGYTFTDTQTGEQTDPNEVNWSEYSSGYFPFQMRQRPGKSNALGVIKFDIQNKFSIYLHDTNQPNLFARNKRALSSGCVRLQSPLGLATWLLEEGPYREVESITKLIDARSTRHLKLEKNVPVYFLYITTWVDEDGATHFSDDPYKMDERDLKEYENAYEDV